MIMSKDNYKYNDECVKLLGIFQVSDVIPPSNLVGGHAGGVIAYPVAIIELESGDVKSVYPNEITRWKE